ncbi:hypothetical protein OSB04_005820 [Centaurea solstitialis]|uniref:Uncharacterized protein n=1 Tax=Centaurea solstitialis TaxID=347529 RepID=A0AA38WPY8_9ASTR|nr:hypothetical protein OSB04_005820 [Centaurea solstitialis]
MLSGARGVALRGPRPIGSPDKNRIRIRIVAGGAGETEYSDSSGECVVRHRFVFLWIRLHQIGSLSCPAAFNVTARNATATATALVRGLERSCRNSSYTGCTKCLGLWKRFDWCLCEFTEIPFLCVMNLFTLYTFSNLKGEGKNGTKKGDRRSELMSRDCQLMGLTWLLAKNKTAYIPTVSAILRALMYSAHPARCSPDQANMPLAVNSLQFDRSPPSSAASSAVWLSCLPRGGVGVVMTILGLMVFW